MKDFTGVYEISTDDGITNALGISDERREELENIIKKSVKDCNRITETLAEIWNRCDHPNEYAWCVFMYGSNMGIHKALENLGDLKKLLDK